MLYGSVMTDRLYIDNMKVPDGCGHVRTIVPSSVGGADGLLYVGTTNNSVLHGSLQDKLATVIHVRLSWARHLTFVADLNISKSKSKYLTLKSKRKSKY